MCPCLRFPPSPDLDPPCSQYFESDKLKGIGSPHTPSGNVWPIALAVEALTSDEPQEQARADAAGWSLQSSCRPVELIAAGRLKCIESQVST